MRSARVDALEDGLSDLAVGAELLEALGGHPDAVGQRLYVRLGWDDDGDSSFSASCEKLLELLFCSQREVLHKLNGHTLKCISFCDRLRESLLFAFSVRFRRAS